MEPNKETFYITGIVVTWITGLVGAGIGIGRSRAKAAELEKRIIGLEAKQQKDIDDIRELIRSEFAKFEAYWHTQDGDDRFLTERRHESICGGQKEYLQKLDKNQDAIFKQLSSLAVSYGKLEERFK